MVACGGPQAKWEQKSNAQCCGSSEEPDSVEITNLNIPNKSGECAKNLVFGTGIVLMV